MKRKNPHFSTNSKIPSGILSKGIIKHTYFELLFLNEGIHHGSLHTTTGLCSKHRNPKARSEFGVRWSDRAAGRLRQAWNQSISQSTATKLLLQGRPYRLSIAGDRRVPAFILLRSGRQWARLRSAFKPRGV